MKYYFIIIFFCFFRKLNEKCISHEKASIKQSYSAARCTALLKFFFLCCCAAIFFPSSWCLIARTMQKLPVCTRHKRDTQKSYSFRLQCNFPSCVSVFSGSSSKRSNSRARDSTAVCWYFAKSELASKREPKKRKTKLKQSQSKYMHNYQLFHGAISYNHFFSSSCVIQCNVLAGSLPFLLASA